MDVRMPDGTVVTNVPDNITQEDLLERYQGYQPPLVSASSNQYDVEPGFFRGIGSLLKSGAESAILSNKISPTVIGGGDVGALAPDIFKELTADPYRPQALREVTSAFQDIGEKGKKAKGVYGNVQSAGRVVAEVGRQLITNPQGVMYMTAEQAANMVPAIVGMMSGAAIGTSVAGPVGGVVGGIGGGFATQAPGEIGSEFIGNVGKELQARGMQVTPANIETLLNDKEFTARAISESRTKGATTAAVDAAFTLGAGKIAAAPRKAALAAATKELGEQATAASKVARAQEILKERGFGQKIVTGGKAVGTEVVGGGASEAAGSLAAYGDVDWGNIGMEMLGELGGSAFEVPAAARALREKVTGGPEPEKPFKYVEPQTGTTMTASTTELNDPSLVFVGTQEVGGRQVYVYAPAEQITPEGRPDLTSPIVATMKTTVDGKEVVKTTRADGSVDIDGVLVTPPRQAPEGDVAQSREQMMAEFEGRQLPLAEQPVDQTPTAVPQDTAGLNDGDLELLAQVTATQPAQFTDPDTGTAIIISLTKLNDPALKAGEEVVYGGKTYYTYVQIPQKDTSGQLKLAPVNPEGTVLPTPPAAPPVNTAGQLTLAPVNPEGTVIAPAKPVDPNVEAQLAAVEPDVESMIPDEPPPVRAAPPAPVVPAKRVAAEPTARYGITDKGEVGVPLTEGGKPFQTRKEAEKVQKLQPQLRVLPIKVKGKVTGYVLADKTQKQLAAEKVAAKRLQAIPVGGLLGDILRQGGINPVHRLVLGFSEKENPSFGNKRLFAAEGKGIDLSDIVEGQEESKAAEDRFEGRDIDVRNSLPDRIKDAIARYNAGESEDSVVDAQERKLAEEEREFEEQENKVIQGVGEQLPSNAEFQDFYDVEVNLENPDQSMLDAGFSQQDLNVVGFTKASPELKAEVAALMAQMEALGLETADILAEISFTPNITDLEYYTRAKSELTKAITQAAKQGSGGNVSQANVSAASEGSEAKNKVKARTIPADNFTRDLSAETDTLYREMSGEGFLDLFGGNQPFGAPVFMFAESKDMALGQGKNRGVTIQVDTQGLRGRPVFNKPALKQAYLDRMGEFEVKAQPSELLKNITSIDVSANAFDGLTKGQQSNLNKILDSFKANGVTVNKPEQGLESPTEAGLKAKQDAIDKDAADKAKADREAAAKDKAEADRKAIAAASEKAAGEFELGKSAEDDLSGQKDIFGGARQLPELDTTGLKIPKGRNPQVVAAGKLFQAGKMSRAEFNEYVAQYTPVAEVPADKIEPPTTLEKILGFFKSPKETERVQKVIPDGTRVGLRMDVPALNAGLPVVSIHEGKINPKTGKPFASAGSVIKYASTGHIKNVTFAPRSQEKSLNMGLNPVKEPLQTAEGEWVNSTPEETFKRVKELSNDKSWTQVGFDPARHGYFYERSTGEPVASASEVYQVGRFLLAKDVKYAPKEDFLYNIKDVEQKENAQMVADNFKGKVVYQNGDISLIQVSNVYNDPVYLPAKGTVYFTNSVESIKDTRKLFTKEELQELLDARLNIEAQDASKHAANPFVTFKNGIATSENVSSELAGIFKQWKSLLKLNQNIYLGTIEDAIAAKDSFAGPQRRIGNAATKLNITGTPGSTQALADGTRYILIDQNQTPAELVEILAHEMGHAHEQEMFNNAPAELQKQIKAEFDKWLNSQKGKTAKEFIYALRAKETAETTNIPNPDMLAKDLKKYDSYWSTFSEWYADQTARWATTSEKPLTAVDKFFAKVAETLRSFFKTLKSAGFLPNTTFKQYMDDITATEIVAANPITSVYEKMPLFATKSAQASLPGMPAAPNKPNKISPASIQKPKPAASWTAPDMNRKDTFIGLVQDRNISLKRVQQVIEKLPTVTQLQDNLNAYRLEDLAHGRVQVQTDDFLKFEFAPIIKEMNDNKVTEEQLTEYLLNRHAKEANELIAKRNPNNPAMQDKGSSVETKVAEDYLKNLPPDQKKLFESIAKKVDKVIVGTQELLYKNGIISKAELDGWRDTFKYYVPLRREETDYVLPSSSFKEIGSYSKSRTGSQKKVTDILSNVGIAREIAIVRSEKEKAKRAVYGLAIANPNPEFWMAVSPAAVLNQNVLIQELTQMGWDAADIKNIMAEPTKAYFNKDTGLVEHKINTQNRYADFVLPVKINGQDRFVFFNPNDKRSASIITALKNADTQKLNAINSYVGNITRYFAAVNTQYNLVFGAWNFVRDVQGAMLNLTTTPLNGKQSAVFQGTFTALKDIYAGIKEKNQGTLQKNPADGSWQDFLEAGGKIGYRDQFAKINDTSTLVARELQSLNRSNAYQKARSVLNWVSSVNDTLENAVRLSAYRVALKQNMSKDQAAEIAKNLTVNFNRKGSATAGLSAYYAFLNASIQGTARLAQTIDPRTKSGKLIIAGGLAIGMAQSLALMAAGFDDDEPSEFLKERNLIIPTGWLTGKRTYAMWPMPLGFNILPNTGRLLIDGAARLADGKGVGDLAINALSMAVSSTNPLGGNAATLQSYMPTIADPFVAVYENKDAFGRPIAKEDRGLNPTPGYTRSREPANPIFQGIAEFMNTITSRDKDVKGLISPTADQLSYIAEQIGGGVYREASRAVKYAVNVLNGEETPEHQVPIAGKIIGDLDSNAAISQKFYTNVKNMAEHELVIKAHRTRRESVAEYMRDNPEARLWQRANSLENEITKLNKTKKELYQREAPQDRIKRVEDQKIRMMKQFNDQVRQIN